MTLKNEHLSYLEDKGEFKIACSLSIFNKEEVKLLKKFGNWFMGLTNGDLDPFTESQRSFVKVFKEEKEPSNKYEVLWFKYLGRLSLENESPKKFNLNYKYEEDGFYSREDYYKLHPTKRNRF